MQKKRNRVAKKMRTEVKRIKETHIDKIKTRSKNEEKYVALFGVVKQLKIPMKRGNASIYNKIGQIIINKKYRYNKIKENLKL